MPNRHDGEEHALRSAISQAQRDLNTEPDTPSHILKTVQQQEEKFERLTRELERERRSVLNQFEQSVHESETGTFASISETDDSFSFRRSAVNESVLESESSIDSKAYNSSHLIDSALNALHAHHIMDPADSMQYSGYNNEEERSYNDYNSPATNGHVDASPGPKQQVKKTTQVTITKQTVQTRIIRSPDGHESPALVSQTYDSQNYSLPANYSGQPTDDYRPIDESPYPPGQYEPDPGRPYNGTPSIDGSERPDYRSDPGRDPYDRSYNETPSDMYAPSVEGDDRYGTAPRSQNVYDPPQQQPQPQYGDRYDDRPVDRQAESYNYADPYDDRYQPARSHDNWDSRMPPDDRDYNGTYNDGYHPDEIPRETATEQMAPLALADRTPSQDTVEYDNYDKPYDKGPYRYRPSHHVNSSHDSLPRKYSYGSGKDDQQWRTPDLQEIIDYLSHTNPAIVANAAGYLQHLTFGDDPIKNKTRSLGGIPVLVELLGNPTPEIHKCACGALRNISFGKVNEENKGAIKNAGGIPALIRLLRTTRDPATKELVTGTLWNLSSSEPLKKAILDDGLSVFVNDIIIPDSGWTPENPDSNLPSNDAWTPTYRNTTGCLRNVSSSGLEARKKMRECSGLVDALMHVIKSAINSRNMDNKVVENAMCIIRNLSFKISNEANHPDAVAAPPPRSTASQNGGTPGSPAKKKPDDTSGCFGGNKKKKMEANAQTGRPATSTLPRGATWDPDMPIPERKRPPRGTELLFAHEMVRPYLNLISDCSNHVTLEATVGTIQNISSGEWVWALYVRAKLRKEKGLPVLVELLRMENDKIVSAVARALRNLSLDSRNKELIGKYAMRDLVFRLPSAGTASNANDRNQIHPETLVAVLNALQELINKNAENSKSLRDASGIEKLVSITKSRNKYRPTVIKCAFQVLSTMWAFKELRPLYKHDGWDETHFSPGIWTTARSPADKSQTLRTPSSDRMGGPTPQRSASTPAPGKLDYEASPLPAKSPPPQTEGYNSYDRRQQSPHREQPVDVGYDNYHPPDWRVDRNAENPYSSLTRQPAPGRDSMSAYSDEVHQASFSREPLPLATDQPGARESLSQYSEEASYVAERQDRMPESFAVPQNRDSISAYSEEAPSERSREDIPMRELNYASIDHSRSNESSSRRGPPVGGVPVFGRDPPPPQQQENVVYAQVNKNRPPSNTTYLDTGGPAGDSWV